jgi:hypothetical protein
MPSATDRDAQCGFRVAIPCVQGFQRDSQIDELVLISLRLLALHPPVDSEVQNTAPATELRDEIARPVEKRLRERW